MRSERNLARLRLMKPMLDNGYIIKYMINARVLTPGENLLVPMDVPMEEISRLAPRVSRMGSRGPNLSSYGDKSTIPRQFI